MQCIACISMHQWHAVYQLSSWHLNGWCCIEAHRVAWSVLAQSCIYNIVCTLCIQIPYRPMWFNPRQAALHSHNGGHTEMFRNAAKCHVSLSPCPFVGRCKKDLKAVPDIIRHYRDPQCTAHFQGHCFRGKAWDYEERCRSKAEGCNRCWLWSHCLRSKQHQGVEFSKAQGVRKYHQGCSSGLDVVLTNI